MHTYLKNVLYGFIGSNWEVTLEEGKDEDIRLIIADIDEDDMPEIVFAYYQDDENITTVLKRKDFKWCLEHMYCKEEASQLGDYIRGVKVTKLREKSVGGSFTVKDLFEGKQVGFLSIVEDTLYRGVIRQREEETQEVIDSRMADVTGNGAVDEILLLGDRPFGTVSGYVTNMKLRVIEGEGNEVIDIPLKTPDGYYPQLYTADFTGDGISDIYVNIFSGRVGSYVFTFIYSVKDRIPELIFDTFVFNQMYNGLVKYEDDYRVRVITQIPAKQYIVDISQKDQSFLLPIYTEDGKLLTESKGNILGLAGLNPIDFDRNGIYNLDAVQRVIGVSNEDTIGLIETFLTWDEESRMFVPFMQYMSIVGKVLSEEELEDIEVE